MEENDAPGPDLVDLLEADHRRVQELLSGGGGGRHLVREIESHLVAESQLLYPAVRRHVAGADTAVDALLEVDHRLEEALAELDRAHPDEAAAAEVASLFDRHVVDQERIFPDLRRSAGTDELRRLGEGLGLAVAQAPTHPHPNLPREGPLEVIADTVASGLDHLRDAVRRDDPDE